MKLLYVIIRVELLKGFVMGLKRNFLKAYFLAVSYSTGAK